MPSPAAMIAPEPPPPPPNHVVATIENLPAEGSGARTSLPASPAGVRQRVRKVFTR